MPIISKRKLRRAFRKYAGIPILLATPLIGIKIANSTDVPDIPSNNLTAHNMTPSASIESKPTSSEHWDQILDNCPHLKMSSSSHDTTTKYLPSFIQNNFEPSAKITGKIPHQTYSPANKETSESIEVNKRQNKEQYDKLIQIADDIRALKAGDVFSLYINSTGGSIATAQKVINAIEEAKENGARIITYGTHIHSAASLIFTAGSYRILDSNQGTVLHGARFIDPGDSSATDDDTVSFGKTKAEKDVLKNSNTIIREHYVTSSNNVTNIDCATSLIIGQHDSKLYNDDMVKLKQADIYMNGRAVTMLTNDFTEEAFKYLQGVLTGSQQTKVAHVISTSRQPSL